MAIDTAHVDWVLSGAAIHVFELEQRLPTVGFRYAAAADAARLRICALQGVTGEEYEAAKLLIYAKRLARLPSEADESQTPIHRALAAYDRIHGSGAVSRVVIGAAQQQAQADCERIVAHEPHTTEGIEATIRRAAQEHGVLVGRRKLSNGKPFLVVEVLPELCLVATIYTRVAATSPSGFLLWNYCLLQGSAEQAALARKLNPPDAVRLHGLSDVPTFADMLYAHDNTQQVWLHTVAACQQMLWLAEVFRRAS